MKTSATIAFEEGVLPTLTALLVALVAGDLLILSYGQSPGEVWRLMLSGTWGNAYGIGQVLYKATTLVFTGLSVAIGLRAGLFNIGAESQLAAGGFCAAALGLLPLMFGSPVGKELELPLAQVVLGGLVTATLLNMVVVPTVYLRVERWRERREKKRPSLPNTKELLS